MTIYGRQSDEEDEKLFINKKIKEIHIDGYGLNITMEDSTQLNYTASDGGYSSYEIFKGE